MTGVNDYLQSLGGPSLLAWHRTNGTHRSAEEYLDLCRALLVRGLQGTRLLYLDTNFWVRLRDAAVGRGTPQPIKLLHTLRAMVRSREALCVSQFLSFLEVGRQTKDSLQASADLLDELTEGVAIAAPPDLLVLECAAFIREILHRDVGQDLCPWTKVGLIHRSAIPDKLPGPATAAQRDAVMKSAVDAFWNGSFRHVFEQFGWDTKSRLSFDLDPQVFAQVAQRKAEQLSLGQTRDQVRRAEFSAIATSELKPIFVDLLRRWHMERGFPEGMSALLRDVHKAETLAVNKYVERSLGSMLPGVAIRTELYVLEETNANSRKTLTTNDWVDWSHAAVALPYCDVFLTERGLAHRLREELKADKQYDCEVIGTLEQALAHLHS